MFRDILLTIVLDKFDGLDKLKAELHKSVEALVRRVGQVKVYV